MQIMILAAFGALGLVAPAAAQTAPGADQRAAGETDTSQAKPEVAETTTDASGGFVDIVVTAQRRSEKLQRVPLAISALNGDDLQRAPVTNLNDIQYAVPNLNISARTSSGVVAIRGIGFDIVTAGADGSVALHSDGVYQSRPTAALAGLYDVERIEVARGPQGTLYGRNATGGAINIISRKPSDTLSGYFNVTVGNYAAVALEGAVGGPLVPGILNARLAGKVQRHSGYSHNAFTGNDIDDLKDEAGRAEFELNPGGALSFMLIGDYYHRDDKSFPSHFGGCVAIVCNGNAGVSRGFPVPDDIRDVNIDQESFNRQKLGGVALTTSLSLGGADLKAITAYRTGQSYFIFDFDGTALPGSFATREENHHEFSQEIQLGHRSDVIDWIVGGFYFHERNYARTNAHFPLNLAALKLTQYFQGGTQFTTAYAGFGEVNWHATPRLTLTVGGRYSSERKRLKDEFTFNNGPINIVARQGAPTAAIPCVVCSGLPAETSFDSFTPKFAVAYEIDPDKLIYATVQKGFKSGGFSVGSVTPAFRPERIWSYEAGLKASWLDRRLVTNIAAYHYDYSDLQVGQVVGLASVISNAAKVKVDGIEFETRARIGAGLELFAQGAFNHARFVAYSTANPALGNGVVLDLSGNLLSNAPKWSGDLGGQYRWEAFSGDLSLRADVFASSRVYFSPFNDAINSQKPYTVENVSLRYDSAGGRWYAGLFARNIFDHTIRSGSFTSTPVTGGFVNVQLQPPRTFGANAGMKF